MLERSLIYGSADGTFRYKVNGTTYFRHGSAKLNSNGKWRRVIIRDKTLIQKLLHSSFEHDGTAS